MKTKKQLFLDSPQSRVLQEIKKIVENFDNEINNFVQVCPKEMLDKLENPISNKKLVGQASQYF